MKKLAAAAAMLMLSLPVEMQVEILLKLSVKSLLTCKCVCKLWFNLISSPKFINDHLYLNVQNKNCQKLMFTDTEYGTGKPLMYSINHTSISSTPDLSCDYIVNEAILMDNPFEYKRGMTIRKFGACNGLICFGIVNDGTTNIFIWNPATREYKEIQGCDFPNKQVYHCLNGFGYDTKTGDYKMVRIVGYKKSDYCEVQVYACGSHSSKTIRTPYKFPIVIDFWGVFLNGALHWISIMAEQDTRNCIVSFDISNEKLIDMPLPGNSVILTGWINTKSCMKVGLMEDCLALVLVDMVLGRTEVWKMQEYGVTESWIKLFTNTQISNMYGYLLTPIMSLKTGEILMYTYNGFVLCDPKNDRFGRVSNFFQENKYLARIDAMVMTHPESCYVESLVSLNSGTYVKKPKGGQIKMELADQFKEN